MSHDFREQIEYLADRAGEERARVAADSVPTRLRNPIRRFIWIGVVLAAVELALLGYFSLQDGQEVENQFIAPNPLVARQDCAGESYRVSQKIVAYAREHEGHPPDSLKALIPEYLEKLPVDPLTLLPLTYTRLENGFRLRCPPPATR